MKKELKILGLTLSISWVSFLTMVLWGKAVSIKFNSFFIQYADILFWSTSILLFVLIILGGISIRAMLAGAKVNTVG